MEQQELKLEQQYLAVTLSTAQKQLECARKTITAKQAEIVNEKQNTSYDLSDFDALVALSQSAGFVADLLSRHTQAAQQIARLEQILQTPYFARIDFRFDADGETEAVYIGRSSLTDEETEHTLIYDWRSPIAGVYYRFLTGNAFYEAPCGKITGEVMLKRQYEIQKGNLQYFFDADLEITDEMLRKLLSQNASPTMKAIVETIQQQQDLVIRDMENDLLLVQGVAGSGKTSIALHRAAYLMYRGLEGHLAANDILILSPSAAFERYISQVLPELGEDQVTTLSLEDILKKLLPKRAIQPRSDWWENLLTHPQRKEAMQRHMRFQMSEDFCTVLEHFLEEIHLYLPLGDLVINGVCLVSADMMRQRLSTRPKVPLGIRLQQLEAYLLSICGEQEDLTPEEKHQLRQTIHQWCKPDICGLYEKLFCDPAVFQAWTNNALSAADCAQFCRDTKENLQSDVLPFADAVAMGYLTMRIYQNSPYRGIRQLIVDEAQDYDPLQYRLLHLLFDQAKCTILGDTSQSIAKKTSPQLYTAIQRIWNKTHTSFITLEKSFRSTQEIFQYSLQFLPENTPIQGFLRNGRPVHVYPVETRQQLVEKILEEMKDMTGSLCLLCRTEKEARLLYAALSDHVPIRLAQAKGAEDLRGTLIMPIYLAKGLEFDHVILCDIDPDHLADDDERQLCYIGCTRALHGLSLIFERKD